MVKRNVCGVMGVHFSSRLSETHPVKHPSIIPACKCIKVMRNYPSNTLKASTTPPPSASRPAKSHFRKGKWPEGGWKCRGGW